MKLSEAREIIGDILSWQMVLMGVTPREELNVRVDLSKYSLKELVKANELVKGGNDRKRKLQEHYMTKRVNPSKGITQNMTVDDRVIAGVYFALHFDSTQEMLVLCNDKGVALVKANYNE